jgi:sarcosine oxidase subunit beta
MDMTMDGSAFICKTPLDNLYLNAGWNYGGFKASPASGWYFADKCRTIHRHVHRTGPMTQ